VVIIPKDALSRTPYGGETRQSNRRRLGQKTTYVCHGSIEGNSLRTTSVLRRLRLEQTTRQYHHAATRRRCCDFSTSQVERAISECLHGACHLSDNVIVSPGGDDNIIKQLTSQFVHITRNLWNAFDVESDTAPTHRPQPNLRRAFRTWSIDASPAIGSDTLQTVPEQMRAIAHRL
jgi:hypothetical protein